MAVPRETSSHAPASRYCQPRACGYGGGCTPVQAPAPPFSSILGRQWCHDSQSFPRSIPDSARAPGGPCRLADGVRWARTAPYRACSHFRGSSKRAGGSGQYQDTPPARHDLVSDVEAHVDGLASLALVTTNRPLTHPTRCFAVPAVHFFLLHFDLFYSLLLCSILFCFVLFCSILLCASFSKPANTLN